MVPEVIDSMNELFPLASAAGMTVGLAVCALIVGLVLAMIFAIWESAKWRPVAWTGSALVTLFRGLPEILVVLFIYFGSSQLLLILSDGFTINLGFAVIPVKMEIENFDVSPFLCGVIALSLLYSAYASQTLRGALKAVPVGQWESGQALGLSKTAIFFRLVMPQMWRHALPGLGNQWLVLLKDTALVSLISVNDLMLQTKSIATRTQEPFTWYVIAAAIYLVITLLSQYILKRIDLGMVFQQYNLWPHLTVLQNLIEAPCRVLGLSKEQARERADKLLERLRLKPYMDRYPLHLSGGQQQRVAIARALMMEPQILLFDEPTAALDPEITAQIVSIIRELAETNITQVIVTHEVEVARKTASRVVYMENGHIIEQGDASCFANPQTDAFKFYLSH